MKVDRVLMKCRARKGIGTERLILGKADRTKKKDGRENKFFSAVHTLFTLMNERDGQCVSISAALSFRIFSLFLGENEFAELEDS